MNAEFNIPIGVDERIERLISRSLDGKLTADERAELAEILRANAAARRLLDEYTEIDRLAIRAIRRDLESAKTAAVTIPAQIVSLNRIHIVMNGHALTHD